MTGPTPPSSSDQFGTDAVQSLVPLVENVLENLDNALGESEDNGELVELKEQYEKERQRRKEAEEVCVYVCCVYMHTYVACVSVGMNVYVHVLTYVYIRMNMVIQYGYTAAAVCTDVCNNIRLYVRMFVPCTYMHLLYTKKGNTISSLVGNKVLCEAVCFSLLCCLLSLCVYLPCFAFYTPAALLSVGGCQWQ